MIRNENLKPIGLKKTLVFYSGKAPKGIRSSWIMNEYRLPHHETERLQKAEISLCGCTRDQEEARIASNHHQSCLRASISLPFKKVSPSNSKESNNILGREKEEMPGRRQSVLGGRGDGNPVDGVHQHIDSLRLASCSSSAEAATTIKLQDQRDHVDGASGLLLRPRTLSFPLVHPAEIDGMQFTSSSPPMAASLEEDIHRLVEYHHQCPENLNIFPNAVSLPTVDQSPNGVGNLASSLPSSLSILAENHPRGGDHPKERGRKGRAEGERERGKRREGKMGEKVGPNPSAGGAIAKKN